jgi:hypothetical protein
MSAHALDPPRERLMGLLGKILAILNVIAAIGFLVVAVMDYGKQRAWATLTFQQDLLIQGLPVDESAQDFNGEIISKKIGPATLAQLQTGAQPVTTQVAEVKQRQAAAQAAIEGAGTEAEKRAKMAEILLPVATTFGEREELKRKIATEPADQLLGEEGPFKTVFREALEGKSLPIIPAPEGGAASRALGDDLRRHAIAHLLFNLGLGDKPQGYDQRLQGIIGLEAFLKEVTNQLDVNKSLVDAYETAIRKESLPFEIKHRELLEELIASAGHLQEQREALQKQEGSRDLHRALVGKRRQDIADLTAQIEAEQKRLDATLTRQKELETALDKANVDAKALETANQSLEKQIRSRELGR